MCLAEVNIDKEGTITENHIKEVISTSYVRAIAGYAGLNFEEHDKDYGIDGTFSGIKIIGKRYISDGFKLDFQLKASINIDIQDEFIKYDLESKTYNDLVDEDIGTPRILILYKFPKEKDDWIKVNEESTVFKDCAWWCSLRGKSKTNNKSRITIKIPRNQRLDEKSLKELMNKVRKGECL